MLKGSHAGVVHSLRGGLGSVLALAPPFHWFPVVDELADPPDNLLTAWLCRMSDGAVVTGRAANASVTEGVAAFTLKGRIVAGFDYAASRAPRAIVGRARARELDQEPRLGVDRRERS